MKICLDNQLLKRATSETKEGQTLLLSLKNLIASQTHFKIVFGWSSLFQYLGLDCILEKIPKFDKQNRFFAHIMDNLSLDILESHVIKLYDQLFVLCLTEIKALSEIHPAYLLECIQKKKEVVTPFEKELFSIALDHYEQSFIKNPSHTLHDLILFLAWDRLCVYLAIIFEQVSSIPSYLKGIQILKDCMVESFQHITADGKTIPGLFRMLEALYAYQLREERLQVHTDEEWKILSETSRALREREAFPDVYYIDAAVVDEKVLNGSELLKVYTLDSPEKVSASMDLARFMISKLKAEEKDWHYTLDSVEVVRLPI